MNNPESESTQTLPSALTVGDSTEKNVKKGCLGCFGVLILMIFGGFVVDLLDLNEPQESDAQRMISDFAGAGNPVALRIKSLNSSTAYNAGIQDGMRDVASAAGNLTSASNLWADLQNLKGAKNGFFDLLATQNQFDSTVFIEYCRGWNAGWDSLENR